MDWLEIKDDAYCANTIIRLLETGNQSTKLANLELSYFAKKIDTIKSQVLVCKGLAQLIVAGSNEKEIEIRKGLFEKLIIFWEEIDIVWVRTKQHLLTSIYNWKC